MLREEPSPFGGFPPVARGNGVGFVAVLFESLFELSYDALGLSSWNLKTVDVALCGFLARFGVFVLVEFFLHVGAVVSGKVVESAFQMSLCACGQWQGQQEQARGDCFAEMVHSGMGC